MHLNTNAVKIIVDTIAISTITIFYDQLYYRRSLVLLVGQLVFKSSKTRHSIMKSYFYKSSMTENTYTQVHGNRNAPSERMFKPIMPRKVSPNESPWEIQLKKKATTTYLSPVVDPFVCVYLLVVSSSSSRLVYLYLSSVAQKSNN